MNFKKLFYILTASLTISIGPANANHDVFYSKHLTPKFAYLMDKDLDFLIEHSDVEVASDRFRKIFQENEEINLYRWTTNRIAYVLGDSKKDQKQLIEFTPKSIMGFSRTEKVKERSTKIMSNIGAAIYLQAEKHEMNAKFHLELQGHDREEPVLIDSPEVGIIQVHKAFFSRRNFIGYDMLSPANTFLRLATYIHEAKHSEHHDHNPGHQHSICPEESEYAGLAACDNNLYGPYAAGGLALLKFINDSGEDLNAKEKEMLTLKALDSLGRVYLENEVDE